MSAQTQRFYRKHFILPQLASRRLLYAASTPAAALARALQDPEHAGLVPERRTEDEIAGLMEAQYGSESAATVIGEAEIGADINALLNDASLVADEDGDDSAPVIRMINAILAEASSRKASDIHLEPYENESVVRFRIDGILRDIAHPPRSLHAALISRIKVMAALDIAERRLPQDGRISLRIPGGQLVDLRVSTLPTGRGERAVLRLLDKGQGPLSLEALGMPPDVLAKFEGLIGRPHGIVLVTGPTGSGKTTTLYAALARLDARTLNIMTVEDPIEYEVSGVAQTQVHPKIGLGFAQSLRAILRQDPDVILIGEIRDLDTAQIAIQASLTGHLVLATLHTNDAASAVTRLVDMGVEPFLLSSSLVGVLAQRLVRRVCGSCRADVQAMLACTACGHTGYKGRTGIFELMVADESVRRAVKEGLDSSGVANAARPQGLRTLHEDGLRLVAAGVTTAEELARLTAEVVDVL